MKRSSPLAPARRKVRPKVPDTVRADVKRRTHGLCAVCLWRLNLEPTSSVDARTAQRNGARRIVHLHHVFDAQMFPELARDAANLIGLCYLCHGRHTIAHERIPREALPADTIALAAGDGPRLNHLDRFYPVADAGRNPASMEVP